MDNMDEACTFERRYSFNMAQCNPVAESTHINGSSCYWRSIGPKHRSYSSVSLNNINSPERIIKSVNSPKSKNVIKIDARIATDVQSNGLASRIVKYHETGTMLNRSMSAHNLYSKPGQFPAVTLKRTNLPYRATKLELSMTRIPLPEKSSYYGNTISGLLRSSSVIGLQSKSSVDLSRENRPILHPPPLENEMAPTRSVLDVLKEISRKRINSNDLDTEEATKKYCNRSCSDIVDSVNTTSAVPQNFLSSSLSCQRYKRQRDCTTPHQSVQFSEVKTSPEQAKKRVCNNNNDITSSLSSSTKFKRTSSYKLNQTMPVNAESFEMQTKKIQLYHTNNKNEGIGQVDGRLENNLRKVDSINPITTITAPPCLRDQSNGDAVVTKRTVSEPLYYSGGKIAHLVQRANKPRLTLFNKSYDNECAEVEDLHSKKSDELIIEDDSAGIHFVKPKKITSKKSFKNPVLERTQKSKLALMLSGLRGELYQNSDFDELDSRNEKQKLKINNNENDNTKSITSELQLTRMETPLTTVTCFSNGGTSNAAKPLNFSANAKTNSVSPSNTLANKTSSPLVGLKLSQPNKLSENMTNVIGGDAAKTTEVKLLPNVPLLGGFTLSATNATTSMVTTSSNTNILKDVKTTTAVINNSSMLNFGQPAQLISSSLTKSTETQSSPILSRFSMNVTSTDTSVVTSSSNSNVINDSNTATTQTSINNMFNFGQPTQLTSLISLNGKTNNLPINTESTSKGNSFDLCQTSTATLKALTTNTKPLNTATLSSSKAFLYNSNVNSSLLTTSSTLTPVGSSPVFNNAAKSNNTFNFSASSLSLPTTNIQSMPITFSTLTSSKTLTTTTMTSISAPTTSSCAVASESLGGLTSTVYSNKAAIANGATICASNEDAAVSFNFDGNTKNNYNNLTATSAPKIGYSFGSDAKVLNWSSNDQNNRQNVSQTTNKIVNTNTPPPFSFNMEGADNAKNNVFSSVNTSSVIDSSSAKTGTQIFSSNSCQNLEASTTPTIFGSTNTNNNTSTSFNFGSNSIATTTTNTNNAASGLGGFSFSSAILQSTESEAYKLGSTTSVKTTALNNTFSDAPALTPQNKSFTFGLPNNKSSNSSSIFGGTVNKQTESATSGFSFGLSTSVKSPTFTFGVAKNSLGDSVNNVSTGFSFGASASAVSKPSEESPKPFSFGAPQPSQQKQVQSGTNNNTNSTNIFGGLGGATKTAQTSAFNLNSENSTNLQPNNIFALPSSNITTGPGDRLIRRATRRLQK